MAHIIVTSDDRRDTYTASAGQTVFTITFPFFLDTDLKVYLTPAGNTASETADILILTTDYTLVGAGNVEGVTREMTLVSAAAVNDTINIIGDTTIDRTADFQSPTGDLLPDTLNDEQDKEIIILQENATTLGLALKIDPLSLATIDTALPPPEANKGFKWDSAGTAIVNTTGDPDQAQTDAAASATAAATSETNAATSETNAATSETNAATSETNAATSETNAATSETNAAATLADALTKANNLSDVADAPTSLSNIGGIDAATTDVLTNKTLDANGTGNVLSNIDIGNAIAASQAEAEAGTENTKLLTSLRVSQAIAALAAGGAIVARTIIHTSDTALATQASGGTSLGTLSAQTIPVKGWIRVTPVEGEFDETSSTAFVRAHLGVKIGTDAIIWPASDTVAGSSSLTPNIGINSGATSVLIGFGTGAPPEHLNFTVDIVGSGVTTGTKDISFYLGRGTGTGTITVTGTTTTLRVLIEIIEDDS